MPKTVAKRQPRRSDQAVKNAGPDNIRPWGRYDVLDEGTGYKVKRITVNPGARLSYQRHRQRQEFWTVVAGQARAVVDGSATDLAVGQTIRVAVGAKHRLENPGRESLRLVEVQLGGYLGEDDIERLEDDYGRV